MQFQSETMFCCPARFRSNMAPRRRLRILTTTRTKTQSARRPTKLVVSPLRPPKTDRVFLSRETPADVEKLREYERDRLRRCTWLFHCCHTAAA